MIDTTGQNQGVYFEAGYALALGLPVIWCCNQEDFDRVHFDARQYNYVIWGNDDCDHKNHTENCKRNIHDLKCLNKEADLNELYTQLCNRIKGTIID